MPLWILFDFVRDYLLPENRSSYYESPTAHNGHKEDSLWANDTPRSRSFASSTKRSKASR